MQNSSNYYASLSPFVVGQHCYHSQALLSIQDSGFAGGAVLHAEAAPGSRSGGGGGQRHKAAGAARGTVPPDEGRPGGGPRRASPLAHEGQTRPPAHRH